METGYVTDLKVDDESFLVASLIDRCPKTMMLRELTMNAIEAASVAPKGKRRVEIDAVTIDGARKLRIWNTGPGLDEASLYKICDIASSVGKLKGLDKNFGMGAKVASLPSNNLGVRYRSCCGGLVHEVILGKRQGVYGRVRRHRPGQHLLPGLVARPVDILEVTDIAGDEGRDLSYDWTEVVLLGMRPEQDTALDPYDGDPVASQFWLPETLYHRFFRIPDDVEIYISETFHWNENVSRFRTLTERARNDFTGYECVTVANGLKIHFFYDAAAPDRPWENRSATGALQVAVSQVAFVHSNEAYDVSTGSLWAYEAPNYGITFGVRHISVFIELPDDYPARPDTYRQVLMATEGDQGELRTREFAAIVRAARPRWLIEVMNGLSGGRHEIGSVLTNLSRLSGTLKLGELFDVTNDEGIATEDETNREFRQACGFDVVILREKEDINDRWLSGRAACFYTDTKELFINSKYESVEKCRLALRDALEEVPETPELDAALETAAVDILILRVARALIFAIAKHLDKEHWKSGHIEKAMSPEAFSIVADDYQDLVRWGASKVREQLGLPSPRGEAIDALSAQ